MILILSNVSKFFKKQIINTLHCFPRCSLDEMRTLWMDENGWGFFNSNSMDENLFLKKIEVTRFTGLVFDLPGVYSIDISDIFMLGPYHFRTINWKVFVRGQ